MAEQLASVEDKCLEKYSTGCQPEGCLCSKIAPKAKSEVSYNTWEEKSGSKLQNPKVEVSYDFKVTKAAQELSRNMNFVGLSQSRSVHGAAIEVYTFTK